jgi:hypothetical protein
MSSIKRVASGLPPPPVLERASMAIVTKREWRESGEREEGRQGAKLALWLLIFQNSQSALLCP